MTTLALGIAACVFSGLAAWAAAQLVMGTLAGKRVARRRLSLEDVLSDSTASFACLSACSALVSALVAWWMLPVLLAVSAVLARQAPRMLERQRARSVCAACEGQLDVMADIVALGVRAGMSFDAALGVYCAKFDGELSRRLATARTSYLNGMATRERALADAAGTVGSKALAQFAETAAQAVRYGSPLAELLTQFSDEQRRRRKARVEQQVARAPVKMLVPLGTCILPALLVLVAGPVLLQILESGM